MLKFPKGYGLGYGQKILKDEPGFKPPMLCVGANTFTRQKVEAGVLQAYDLHWLFFPNAGNTYIVGVLGVERRGLETIFLNLGEGSSIDEAIGDVLSKVNFREGNKFVIRAHAMLWLTHSIYRCPKISLKDVLSLESYKKTA